MIPGREWYERFTADESATTEVIGIVLMVAVTVVLAATAAPAFESYADGAVRYPSTTFAFEHSDCDKTETLEVTHVAGDAVDASALYLRSPDLDLGGSWADPSGYETDVGGDGTVQAGDTATICGADLSKATVNVVWESESGESIVLATWRDGR